jgi:transglutaminase-like putative cysteine protease
MAATEQATGQGARGLLVVALVALAGATAAAFGRVFEGAAPSARLVAAAVIAVLIAALFERRSLLLSLAASAVGLFWCLALFVFPRTLWWGFPSLETYDALLQVLRHVGEDAIREVAPAPDLDSLMTASVVAVWTAATASHALAVRSHSAILALLPPAALVGFADVVVDDGVRPAYAVAFLLAAIAVLFGSGIARLEVWGPLIPWIGAARRRVTAMGGATGRWARRLALGAAAAALLIPGILPGFGGRGFLDLEPGNDSISVTPIVDIRPALLRNPPATLFTVRADEPAYWRMLSLDTFDGQVWSAGDYTGSQGRVVSGQATLTSVDTPGSRLLEQDFEIAELAEPWLPAAFEPAEVRFDITEEGGSAVHDEESEMLVRRIDTHPGYRYGVVSRISDPDPADLDSSFVARQLSGYTQYLQLPENLPPRIEELAQEIGQGETAYRRVLAIQNYLQTFDYDERAPRGHGSNHILNFLEETQRGFCEQFAGTMAVLVRSLGYPARVAVGFLPGEQDDSGRWVVTTEHIHAWVEVLFPGFGWLAFEPTPRGDNPVDPLYWDPGRVGGPNDPEPLRPGVPVPPPGATQGRGQQEFGDAQAPATPITAPTEVAERRSPWVRLVLGLLTLAAVAAVAIPAGKRLARYLAVRRARTPRDRVAAAWRAFEIGATDLGLGRRPGETVAEYRNRLRSEVEFSDGHLERITGAAGRAFYASDGISRADADEAGRTVSPLLRDLGRHAGPARRLLGAVRPSWPG